MLLTLKVVRSPEGILPEPRRVTGAEITIGRGPDNDWVLPDPHRQLSKRHCSLTLRSGRWSLTDRSTNGTFVNRDIQPVGDGQTRNLRDGDRLRLGLYEIEVRITEEETLHGRHTAWISLAGIDTPTHDPFVNDPFGNDPFSERPDPPRQAAESVPDMRDATLAPDEAVPPLVSVVPEPAPRNRLALSAGRTDGIETVNFAAVQTPVETGAADRQTALLAAFMRGVGMPDARPADPAAVMESLGATFRAVVVGLREVMITRAKIKSEFRIEQTLMRANGNNPLKFSADDDDALAALLGIGRRTDMKPADAVAGALRDLLIHEAATIAGMRAGMRAALSRIDPQRLAAAAEADTSPEGKARAWDLFVRQHADIAAAAPDDFEGIFGRAFGRGYEQAVKDND